MCGGVTGWELQCVECRPTCRWRGREEVAGGIAGVDGDGLSSAFGSWVNWNMIVSQRVA